MTQSVECRQTENSSIFGEYQTSQTLLDGSYFFSKFADLYCGYRQKYVIMTPEYTKTVNHYFSDKVLESHVNGFYAVCVFAGPKATTFLTFDIDAGGKAAVRKVVNALADNGIPRDKIYISTSGRKGYHVDMFFDPFIYNDAAKNIYDLVIWTTKLDPSKVEFRPTNTQAIKLPLGVHATTRKRCWYLDPVSLEPIEDINYIYNIEKIPAQLIREVRANWNRKRWNNLYAEMVCGDTGDDGVAEKNSTVLAKKTRLDDYRLTDKHTRHETMVEIARNKRMAGASAATIQRILMEWYSEQDPELIGSSKKEVRADAEEIAAWAERSVPVLRVNRPEEGGPKFTKADIYYIMKAKTATSRKVAVLLYLLCKMYGEAHISYERIADTVGCSLASVKSAISEIVKSRIITRQSGGLYIKQGQMIKKSNTYTLPRRREAACLQDDELLAEECVIAEKYEPTKFNEVYYKVIGTLCTDEYLEQHISQRELEEVRNARSSN